MQEGEALYPLSARTLAIAAGGLVTALPPWWLSGTLASAVGHTALGVAILAYGLWGTWRPLVEIVVAAPAKGDGGRGEVLRYRPRLAPARGADLALADVAAVLPTPRTGHAPSERDLAAWVGVRLRSGAMRWLDLGELRHGHRGRVRRRLEQAAADGCGAGLRVAVPSP